jgi:hypothetical protein
MYFMTYSTFQNLPGVKRLPKSRRVRELLHLLAPSTHTMDGLLFNASSIQLVALRNQELVDVTANEGASADAVVYGAVSNLKYAKAQVSQFIVPKRGSSEGINIDGWSAAHGALTPIWNLDAPGIAAALLPSFTSSQPKRRRTEVDNYLMLRPIFKKLEDDIFKETADGVRGLCGLTGPQGFGKSVFLHCLALKRAFGATNNLFVWISACPQSLELVKEFLALAFYSGCHCTS